MGRGSDTGLTTDPMDWYRGHFETETKNQTLDLSDLQTSILDRYDDKLAARYESDFIDDLYGTDDARWTSSDDPTRITTDVEATWGLDLERVVRDDLDPGSVEHYEHLTKGEVNWAHYENSGEYQNAFKYLVDNSYDPKKGGPVNHYSPMGTHQWDAGDYGSMWKKSTDQMKVQFIRDANRVIAEGKGADVAEWRETWEGKYDPNKIYSNVDAEGNRQLYMDGERQQTIKEKFADGGGRLPVGFTTQRVDQDGNTVTYSVSDDGTLGPNAFDPVAGPPTAVIKPNIPVPDVKVKVPGNIPQSWGEHAKSTIKISDYTGGKS